MAVTRVAEFPSCIEISAMIERQWLADFLILMAVKIDGFEDFAVSAMARFVVRCSLLSEYLRCICQ